MKNILELNLGFSDAQNYTQRGNKQMFNEVFVKNAFLEKIITPSCYFIIGEKGTGKTAYATFLNNNEYKNNISNLKFILATDYEKFHMLKKEKKLEVSSYGDIWKVILQLLLSNFVTDNRNVVMALRRSKIEEVMNAINEYYYNAFSPEINTALKIFDKSEEVAKLMCKYAEVGGLNETSCEFSEAKFQMNLFYINKMFTDSLLNLKLNKNIILLIDGIDIRPNNIPYTEYLECIRGLSDACWYLNTEIFQNHKDTQGHFKIILLLRPDIFNSLNLQNSTNKILDNSAFLEWRTTYTEFHRSYLFSIAEKILSYNNKGQIYSGLFWDYYFNWRIPTKRTDSGYDNAFVEFLRISLSRPRDILVIMQLIQKKMNKDGLGELSNFDFSTYKSDEFQNSYSTYFLSSLKDYLSFYYSVDEFKHFIKFFDFFDESDFTFDEYQQKYDKFVDYILENATEVPRFLDSEKEFLQLLYDSNIIAAIENDHEGNNYYHFSYREKNEANISPEVPFGKIYRYRFHYGLYKKAQWGRF